MWISLEEQGAPRRAPRPSRGVGFTLIELLVVVSIISLLVGILVPVVTSVIAAADLARTKARMVSLSTGCYAFKDATGYFPGQEAFAQLTGSDPAGPYTGSQVLAACLFGCAFADLNNPAKPPPISGDYAPVKVGDLDKFDTDGDGTWAPRYYTGSPLRMNTVLDRASDAMAVLYYPYRMNADPGAISNVYKYNDNSVYVDTTALWNDYKAAKDKDASYSLDNYKTDMRAYFAGTNVAESNVGGARNAGGFLMIAAGKSRLYFSGDDVIFPQ